MSRGPIRFKIEGLREVQSALRQLPDATAKRILRKVMKRRLDPIASTMRTLAPKDDGHLERSIKVGTKLSRRQRRAHRKTNPHDVEMFAGPGALPQAVAQEFGTEHHDPQSFVRPAWDQKKNGLLQDLARDLWVEVKRSIARRRKGK